MRQLEKSEHLYQSLSNGRRSLLICRRCKDPIEKGELYVNLEPCGHVFHFRCHYHRYSVPPPIEEEEEGEMEEVDLTGEDFKVSTIEQSLEEGRLIQKCLHCNSEVSSTGLLWAPND